MEEKRPKRHRVHNGLSGKRLDRAAVMLEIWTQPDAGATKPYHVETLTSVEWVDLIAGVIVGDLEVSATDLNALRSDIARWHERWRSSLEQRAGIAKESSDGGDVDTDDGG